MLQRLVEFALAQRLVVVLVTALGVGAGIAAWQQLPIDAFPDISPTQVKLILKAPGMTPEEVESRVIVPLEYELLGIPRQWSSDAHVPTHAHGHAASAASRYCASRRPDKDGGSGPGHFSTDNLPYPNAACRPGGSTPCLASDIDKPSEHDGPPNSSDW